MREREKRRALKFKFVLGANLAPRGRYLGELLRNLQHNFWRAARADGPLQLCCSRLQSRSSRLSAGGGRRTADGGRRTADGGRRIRRE